MAGVTYFVQECPTCGRRLQVRVVYLGKCVACHHCGAQFAACDPQSPEYPPLDSALTLLVRGVQFLQASVGPTILPQLTLKSSTHTRLPERIWTRPVRSKKRPFGCP